MAGSKGTRAAAWIMAAGVAAGLVGFLLLLGLALLPTGVASGTLSRSARVELATGAGGLLILAGLVFCLGLVLYLFLPLAGGGEAARRDYGSHRVVLASTAFAAVLGNVIAAAYFLLLPLLVGSPGGRTDLSGRVLSPEGIVVSALSLDLALLAVVYLRIVRPGAITFEEMGLNLHGLFGRLLLGLLFGLLLFAAGSLVEYLLGLVGIRQTQLDSFQSITRASPGEFGLVLLAGAVVAPFAEEVFFRGYVFHAYLRQKGLWRAFLYSSLLFAVVHLNLPAVLPIFVVGLLLAFLYYRTGSVVPGMVAHGLNNALAFMLLYLGLS
jgi:uncharacterized protein